MKSPPPDINKNNFLWAAAAIIGVIIIAAILLQLASPLLQKKSVTEPVDFPTTATQTVDLKIITKPASASVIIAGNEIGRTPITIKDLPPGSLVVKIIMPGYQDHTETVSVYSQEIDPINIILQPTTGNLILATNPAEAQILINGKLLGVTPKQLHNFPPGSLKLVLKKECYDTLEKEIVISTEEQDLTFSLEKICGRLQVTSVPAGGHVYIMGKYQGKTPCTISGVKEGKHKLLVRKKGLPDWQKSIRIKAGQLTKKEVSWGPPLNPKAGKIWREPNTGMEFVWVKGNCYQMGNPESDKQRKELAKKENYKVGSFLKSLFTTITDTNEEESENNYDLDEAPVHKVCLSGLWVGIKEVTNDQYKQFSDDTGNRPEWLEKENKFNLKTGSSEYYQQLGGKNLADGLTPVVGVSWHDTKEFTDWFSRKFGLNARLLTEAEWEFVCRSGGLIEEFAGGDELDLVAWYTDNSDNKSHRVGQLQANGLGIYDLSGNVWEWTMDAYDANAYDQHKNTNPIFQENESGCTGVEQTGARQSNNAATLSGDTSEDEIDNNIKFNPPQPILKYNCPEKRNVVRGGSWMSPEKSLRCTSRYGLPADDTNAFLGFRIVLIIK